MTLDEATGSAGTIKLDGRLYPLKQLTLAQFGDVRAFVKERIPNAFSVVNEALTILSPPRRPKAPKAPQAPKEASKMTPKEQEAWMKTLAAYGEAQTKYEDDLAEWEWRMEVFERNRKQLVDAAADDQKAGVLSSASAAANVLSSPEGLAYQLYLSIKQSDPTVTYETVLAGVNKENVATIQAKVSAITALPDSLDEPEGNGMTPETLKLPDGIPAATPGEGSASEMTWIGEKSSSN